MPRTVKAAVAFEPSRPLEIRDVTLADPGPGEVLVRFAATGICHSDLHILDSTSAQVQPFPIILGHEGIGDVVEVGEGVTDFATGDRVIPFLVPDCGVCPLCQSGRTNACIQTAARLKTRPSPFSIDGKPISAFMQVGSFAEMSVVPADMLAKVSMEARTDEACCIACGVTTGIGAALISAKVNEGASVVVFGAGGVGLSVIQGSRIAKAARIIAVDTNNAKKDVALALGATDFINPKEVDDVVAEITKMTGMGADFAFDCVGVPALSEQSLKCVNFAWGVAINVGIYPADAQIKTAPSALMMGRRLTGSFMGGAKRQDVTRFVDMYVAGEFDLDKIVSHRLKLTEINRGFDLMRSGESVRSVVLYPG